MRPFENANAAFHTRMPLASGDKPLAAFVCFTRLRFVTGLGQDDAFDAHVLSQLFVARRIEAAVGAGLLGWMLEELLMCLQAWLPLLCVGRIALQNAIVTDDAAVHFVEPDFVTVFHGVRFLAAADNVCVRFKDADDFLLRRNLLVLKDAPLGLADYSFGERDEVLQRANQALGGFSAGLA